MRAVPGWDAVDDKGLVVLCRTMLLRLGGNGRARRGELKSFGLEGTVGPVSSAHLIGRSKDRSRRHPPEPAACNWASGAYGTSRRFASGRNLHTHTHTQIVSSEEGCGGDAWRPTSGATDSLSKRRGPSRYRTASSSSGARGRGQGGDPGEVRAV